MSKVLIVGGGSVGQVYGWALSRAGAEVHFYLKSNYAEAAKQGFTLYRLNQNPKARAPVEFNNFKVLTQLEEVASQIWDQIYITVSSTALRSGWLTNFAAAAATVRTVVMLQPGMTDRDFMLQFFPSSKLVSGIISVIAYSAPLPESHEQVPRPGTAFYFPPFKSSHMSGPEDQVRQAARLLSSGGLAANYSRVPVAQKVSFENGILMAFVSALEGANWSLKKLKSVSHLNSLSKAIREMMGVVSAAWSIPIPWAIKIMTTPSTLKFLITAAPKVLPFELEPYLKAHFTKVGDQTRLIMKESIEFAVQHDLPFESLQELENLAPSGSKNPQHT